MDLTTFISRVLGRIVLVVVITAIGALAGFGFSRFASPTFASEARLIVGQTLTTSQVDYSDILASQLLAQTYADLAVTTPILEAAGRSLSPAVDAAELSGSITSRAPVGSVYVVIRAVASDASGAAAAANAVARALQSRAPADVETVSEAQAQLARYLEVVDDQIVSALAEIATLTASEPTPEILQQLTALQAEVDRLQSQRAALADSQVRAGSNLLTIVEPASTPSEAFQPRTIVNTALGALVGGVIAVALALILPPARGRANRGSDLPVR